MAWLYPIEEFFLIIAQIGEVFLEGIAIICVFIRLLATAKLLTKLGRRRQKVEFPFVEVRLKFGLWLALALEFQLGADILNTTIAPSTDALIQLAVIAVIRTFLNYFLNKEIEAEIAMREKSQELQHQALFADERLRDKPDE